MFQKHKRESKPLSKSNIGATSIFCYFLNGLKGQEEHFLRSTPFLVEILSSPSAQKPTPQTLLGAETKGAWLPHPPSNFSFWKPSSISLTWESRKHRVQNRLWKSPCQTNKQNIKFKERLFEMKFSTGFSFEFSSGRGEKAHHPPRLVCTALKNQGCGSLCHSRNIWRGRGRAEKRQGRPIFPCKCQHYLN